MTLDEAIKKAEEIAEEKFNNAVYIMDKMKSDVALKNVEECKRFAEEHRQLAEWLKDYKRLKEQEPCDDAISRQAVLDLIADYDLSMGQVVNCIHSLPSVNPQPKTGHWVFVDKAHEHAHCSECDYGNVDLLDGRPHNYCPNCGAKMESEK